MRKSKFDALLRKYVREYLTPTESERTFVSKVYESVQNLLGVTNCLQIGSFSRFTAITPLHDLDVLYILGRRDPPADPSDVLDDLLSNLKSRYTNPTDHRIVTSRQSHSVTIDFFDGINKVFSTDIVPAYISGRNDFQDDMYFVPEIVARSHNDRKRILEEVSLGKRAMGWIKSDPRGYISMATQVNAANNDFRKSVKIIKCWLASYKSIDDGFPLKSFHLEQAITRNFQKDINIEIFDAIFSFFCEMPNLIEKAQIPDRSDPNQKIDAYVKDFNDEEKKRIIQARDFFLINLEELKEDGNISDLFCGGLHKRASDTESYLFDQKIPILTDTEFTIKGRVLPKSGGFREKILDATGVIEIDRKIEFRLGRNAPNADVFKWKVKNDNKSEQPRGEITDHHTLREPEDTKYNGHHYVECFAINNGVCFGRSRQNVVLQSPFCR